MDSIDVFSKKYKFYKLILCLVDGQMRNILEKLGPNAGKVWETLDAHGSLIQAKLIETTRLNEEEFYAAVGWLARENKIHLENELYILGETNLTDEIGTGAGKVLNTIEVCGEVDVSSISRLIDVDETNVYHALGWLAREDKIQAKKGRIKQSPIKFKLK